jgi:hypothetical protein
MNDLYNYRSFTFAVVSKDEDLKSSCCYLSSTRAKQIVDMAAHGFVGTWEVNKPVNNHFPKPIRGLDCYVVHK